MPKTNNFPVLYNTRILADQMEKLKKTPEQVAKDAGMSLQSVNAGLAGSLRTLKKLRSLADALKVNWKFITDTDLEQDQFHRAVVNGRAER